MKNPYRSEDESPQEWTPAPFWYVWFYHLYQPAWWIGTALIVASWSDIVSPAVGWTGFAIAAASVLGSYILPPLAGVKHEDYVFLDSRLLRKKDETYLDVIQRFRNGASLTYDGVTFAFFPNNEIACSVVDNTSKLDDSSATEIADHAKSVFDQLISECKEFSAAVDGRTLHVSIMSDFTENARELCRVIDGRIEWLR